jgi:hypothetical protein
MATIELPEKAIFERRVQTISNRIDGITKSNTMAGLLNSNFKKWLSNSAMSPVALTEELDTNNDLRISGNEFASLLGKMTGERPPEWVVEIVFSFVEANPKDGIPIDDWMAFLAASGLDIPEELFEEKIVISGSIAILEENIVAGEAFSVTVSFNHDVVAYEFAVVDQDSGQSLDNMLTANVDMDRPDFDEFTLEIDEPGSYLAELRHLGTRLDAQTFVVSAKPTSEGMAQDEPLEVGSEIEEQETDVHVEVHAEEGFDGFVTMVEAAKLRSDAQAMIAKAPAYIVHSNINAISRTLLGQGDYRNGYTAHCTNDAGVQFRVMLKPSDAVPAIGERFERNVALHDWDVALKQMVCREL